MKKQIFFLTLFLSTICFSQVAFNDEVTEVNGVVEYENKPFTGKLYSSEENSSIKNACKCSLIAKYSNGKLNGTKGEWYNNGNKKFQGSFRNGNKIGTHFWYSNNGVLIKEITYSNNKEVVKKEFYALGTLKSEVSKDYSTKEETHRYYYENGNLKLLRNFLNGKKHGIERVNTIDGIMDFESKFENGSLVFSKYTHEEKLVTREISGEMEKRTTYFPSGKIYKVDNVYFLTGQPQGFQTIYNELGQKVSEKKYDKNKIIEEGEFLEGKKNGVWKFFDLNDKFEIQTVYENGKKISEIKIDYDKLVSKNTKEKDLILQIDNPLKARKEYAVLRFENSLREPYFNLIENQIIKQFNKRTAIIRDVNSVKDEQIEGTILISDVFVKYKTSIYTRTKISQGKRVNYDEKGYDAFINYNVKITDTNGKLYLNENYKINKSDKLLNSLLSTAVKSYSKSKEQAFKKELGNIFLSNKIGKFFPIYANLKEVLREDSKKISKVLIDRGSAYGVQKKMIFKVYDPNTKKFMSELRVIRLNRETAECKVISGEKWLKSFVASSSKILIVEAN